MGLFTQRPEHHEEWAGLPSEPARPDTDAERLADAAPAVDALGFGSIESIVIPVAPVVDVARAAASDADPDLDLDRDADA
ncbi:hypothetical protein [Microbacterium sp. Root180]|uniref:hypothetical protein n=1 Tax=Microbacterium sp. Root180 TaxID=1736483 RepID=UPI0006F2C5AC|nr:hypothetical protein [Microbacterium sp. Root180]KRB35734.1 hypothetical protein ASD93_14965 [Microbacterium sp. Root180]